MAFGHDDVDRMYDNIICPILESKHIEPVRVDRLHHNDSVDDRIITEIRRADFAIADLTFARPSV
jgi:hypothetical protein